MKILDVNKVNEGQILGRSVFDTDGNIVVPAGTALTPELVHEIRKSGTTRIYLFDENAFDTTPEQRIKDYVKSVIHLLTSLDIDKRHVKTDTSVLFSKKIVRDRIKNSSDWLFIDSNDKKKKNIFSLYETINENNQDYFIALPKGNLNEKDVEYLLDTMLMCGVVAGEMDFSESEITQIFHSCLLHTIGLLLFADLVEEDFNSLAPDIKALFHEYPVLTTIMIKACDPSSLMTQRLVLFHHKRKNGTGFPIGIQNPKEDEFSRFSLARDIISVGVEFNELIFGRMGNTKISPLAAITQLYILGEEVFNLSVLRIFSRLLQLFPEGSFIRIRSNSSGRFVGFSGIIRDVEEIDGSIQIKSILLTKNALGEEIDPKSVDVTGERHLLLE